MESRFLGNDKGAIRPMGPLNYNLSKTKSGDARATREMISPTIGTSRVGFTLAASRPNTSDMI